MRIKNVIKALAIVGFATLALATPTRMGNQLKQRLAERSNESELIKAASEKFGADVIPQPTILAQVRDGEDG
jgi:hypothetical protein